MNSSQKCLPFIPVAIPVSDTEVWTRTCSILNLFGGEGMVRVGRSLDRSVLVAVRRQEQDNPIHGTVTADIGEEPKLLNGFPAELGITARLIENGKTVVISQISP